MAGREPQQQEQEEAAESRQRGRVGVGRRKQVEGDLRLTKVRATAELKQRQECRPEGRDHFLVVAGRLEFLGCHHEVSEREQQQRRHQ